MTLDVIPSLGLDSKYPKAAGAGLGEPPSIPHLDSREDLFMFENAKRYLKRIT